MTTFHDEPEIPPGVARSAPWVWDMTALTSVDLTGLPLSVTGNGINVHYSYIPRSGVGNCWGWGNGWGVGRFEAIVAMLREEKAKRDEQDHLAALAELAFHALSAADSFTRSVGFDPLEVFDRGLSDPSAMAKTATDLETASRWVDENFGYDKSPGDRSEALRVLDLVDDIIYLTLAAEQNLSLGDLETIIREHSANPEVPLEWLVAALGA